jgi:ketosteroid isomerase-like protein
MPSALSTRDFLALIFARVHETGLGEDFFAALAEDLSFTATGDSPLAGHYASKAEYQSRILDRLHERLVTSVRPTLEQMVIDGEWGVLRLRSEGVVGKNGADFSMQYTWWLHVVDGRITEIIGFYDTHKMHALFA